MKTFLEKPETLEDAWNKLHHIQCQLEYYLQETNSTRITPTKHMLDMVFEHLETQIQIVKDVLKKRNKK